MEEHKLTNIHQEIGNKDTGLEETFAIDAEDPRRKDKIGGIPHPGEAETHTVSNTPSAEEKRPANASETNVGDNRAS